VVFSFFLFLFFFYSNRLFKLHVRFSSVTKICCSFSINTQLGMLWLFLFSFPFFFGIIRVNKTGNKNLYFITIASFKKYIYFVASVYLFVFFFQLNLSKILPNFKNIYHQIFCMFYIIIAHLI